MLERKYFVKKGSYRINEVVLTLLTAPSQRWTMHQLQISYALMYKKYIFIIKY
jgi:hypothetical protein